MDLNFTIEPQRCTEWCWAAVVAAVCNCYGDASPANQCDVAELMLGTDCDDCDCQQDRSAPCNQPFNLGTVLSKVRHNLGNPVNGVPTLSLEDVKSSINDQRPIVVQVELDDAAASGHAIAIFGCTDSGIVSIADPMHAGDKITVPLADFVAGTDTSHGKWQGAYLTKRRGQ